MTKDAKEFYAPSHHLPYVKKMSKHIDQREVFNAELMAECYIGFAKLLNEEMRAFDMKDSMIFDTLKVSSFTKGNPSASGTLNAKPTTYPEIV